MNICPVTTFDDLRQQAFSYVQRRIDRWDDSQFVPLEHGILHPITPECLQLGTELWTKIGPERLLFQVGLGCEVKTGWKSTHLHADLETGSAVLHIDYFSFITWGPLCGVLGYIVSLDGAILGVGGRWGCPPGGGCRNWPLAVLIGSQQLLTADAVHSFKQEGDMFLCEDITLWRKENAEQAGKANP